MKVQVEIPDSIVDDIVCRLPRDNPRKAWTNVEKKQLLKEWLRDMAFTKANELPGRNHR